MKIIDIFKKRSTDRMPDCGADSRGVRPGRARALRYVRATAAAALGAMAAAVVWAAVQCACYYSGLDGIFSLMGAPCFLICLFAFRLVFRERSVAGYVIVLLLSLASVFFGQYLGEYAKAAYLIFNGDLSLSLSQLPDIVSRMFGEGKYAFSAVYDAVLGAAFAIAASVPYLISCLHARSDGQYGRRRHKEA